MREIKFRAWHNHTESMLAEIWLGTSCTLNEAVSDDEDFEVMQYTGLKDKKGVEIYEGDIVVYEFNNLIHRVEFQNGSFVLRRKFENIVNLHMEEVNYGSEIEVIGNIHENQELLEV